MILSETTVKKSASDATPLLGGQLLESIITDKAYPLTLFNAILTRIRAGEEINQTKAAVIKAVLIRNFKSEVATVSLNKDSKNIPYILGRLFSVLEYLQEKANGSSTIRQRYFSSACSNPVNVFPTLLSLSMHHADKLDNATWFEKQKSDLISNLDAENPFPSALSLQQQGEFIVGYYHQQQDRYTKKEEK
jgi:CRISPR-associated protein Csd1